MYKKPKNKKNWYDKPDQWLFINFFPTQKSSPQLLERLVVVVVVYIFCGAQQPRSVGTKSSFYKL